MKKIKYILAVVLVVALGIPQASALSTDDWYAYNGSSTKHSFSLKFPTDWKAHTLGDDIQAFAPSELHDDLLFYVHEFEGQTYSQAINYFKDESTSVLESKDFVLSSSGEDLIAKGVTYIDIGTGEAFAKTFVKRGSLIIAITKPTSDEYGDIMEGIYSSFSFTDNWHQYIDFKEKYSFIFPENLKLNNLSDGVEIYDDGQIGTTIFSIIKYENSSAQESMELAEGYSESAQGQEEVLFHGIEGTFDTTYTNDEKGKSSSKLIIEKGESSYALTNLNIESNYPHLNYYDQYIVETLEGFEFFDIEEAYHSYANFPDVRDDHVNAVGINNLTNGGVIAGYPDGTFRPDGDINRAELTKMIVATAMVPELSEYNNCFPDVKEEWFAPFICYAKDQGWVEGYPDGTFKPDNKINRVESIKIILEVLFKDQLDESEELKDKTAADIDTEDWYGKYFVFADNNHLLDKQHVLQTDDSYSYSPAGNISRKEVAESIYRSLLFLKIQ